MCTTDPREHPFSFMGISNIAFFVNNDVRIQCPFCAHLISIPTFFAPAMQAAFPVLANVEPVVFRAQSGNIGSKECSDCSSQTKEDHNRCEHGSFNDQNATGPNAYYVDPTGRRHQAFYRMSSSPNLDQNERNHTHDNPATET